MTSNVKTLIVFSIVVFVIVLAITVPAIGFVVVVSLIASGLAFPIWLICGVFVEEFWG